jgi:hypothetical protein
MFSRNFFLAIIITTIAITTIQWFFIGYLFHRFQALTPATWRKESSRSYLFSTVISFFFAFLFTTLFYYWKSTRGGMDLLAALKFAGLCWLTFSVSLEIGNAVYVNYSPMFVLGKCLSSLVEYLAAISIAWALL